MYTNYRKLHSFQFQKLTKLTFGPLHRCYYQLYMALPEYKNTPPDYRCNLESTRANIFIPYFEVIFSIYCRNPHLPQNDSSNSWTVTNFSYRIIIVFASFNKSIKNWLIEVYFSYLFRSYIFSRSSKRNAFNNNWNR